ncbi:hypothetical protein ACOME3_005974 [Neoechinorhynchus agilis]
MSSDNTALHQRRLMIDIGKILDSKYDVNLLGGKTREFTAKLDGPKDTIYEGGRWLIHVSLTADYPLSPPRLTFRNPIYHPNICPKSGIICMNVFHADWSPVYDLKVIFDLHLPQLLTYPNSDHGYNGEACKL